MGKDNGVKVGGFEPPQGDEVTLPNARVQYLNEEQAKSYGLPGAGFYQADVPEGADTPDWKNAIPVTEQELREAGVEFVQPPEFLEFSAEAAATLGLGHGAGWYLVVKNDDGSINESRPATQAEIAKITGAIGEADKLADELLNTTDSGVPQTVKCDKTGKICVPVYRLHLEGGGEKFCCRECMPPASQYVGFDYLGT